MSTQANRTSEKWLEKSLSEYVSGRGGATIKLSDPAKNGLPDRLILWPGGVAEFVELKSTGKTKSFIQRAVAPLLIELGFRYTTIDSEETLRKWQDSHHAYIRTQR